MNIQEKKVKVARLSVISNTILVLLKLIIGISILSVSIISEAIHSGIDLIAAIIAFFAVKTSNKPPDSLHPFGHGKYENISGAMEALLIFVAAGWIIFESIEKLVNPTELNDVQLGVYIMGFSALANIYVSRKLFKIGQEADSIALKADATHLLTDVYTSIGVAIGLGLIAIGKIFFPEINLSIIDPIVAIVVAIIILKSAYDLTKQSVSGLLDTSLPKQEKEIVLKIINSFKPRINSFHHFRTRKSGAERFIEFHLVVDSSMTVVKSHDICDEITLKIRNKLSNAVVMIHTEPLEKAKPETHN